MPAESTDYITTMQASLSANEIVTVAGNGGGAMAGDKMRMNVGGGTPIEDANPLRSIRPGQQNGGDLSTYPSNYCDVGTNPGQCWGFSDSGWDTLLYHITPGTHTYPSTGLSTIQVLRSAGWRDELHENMRSTVEHGLESTHGQGWNALLLNVYSNNINPGTPFWQRYAQIIFSTSWIACPQV